MNSTLINLHIFTELPDHLLKRKIDLCHELLEISDKIEPGWTRLRGTLLLDLQSAMTVETKREYEAEKITKAAAQVLFLLLYFTIFCM